MHVAIDLQPSPALVPKALKRGAAAVVLFYAATLALSGYWGLATTKKLDLVAKRAELNAQLARGHEEMEKLDATLKSLKRQEQISGDLSEWLTTTPPTQALTLLLAREIEPNISLSRLVIEMEPGAPNVKITVDVVTPNKDAASRQASKFQIALKAAGFITLNTEHDDPTPEGWNLVVYYALPREGQFASLTRTPGT